MLTGVAEALSLSADMGDGLRMAVSEACNNVVLHAYPGSEGPMSVDVVVRRASIQVVVRDQGAGIVPHADLDEVGVRGVGLAVVQAFTDHIELRGAADEGTEVSMEFASSSQLAPPGGPYDTLAPPLDLAREAALGSGSTLLALAPTPLISPLLAHVTAALATQAHFTVDRLADTQLVSDTIAAYAPDALADGRLVLQVDGAPRAIALILGPLRSGAAAALLATARAGTATPVIERLSDRVVVREYSDGEQLTLQMSDGRG